MTASHQAQAHTSTHASGHSAGNAAASTLGRALEQSEAATDVVQKSAEELLVINAVLKHEIPDDVQTGELAQALEKTDALEGKIHEAAQELTQVNEALAQEIAERGELEAKLAAAKAALAKAGSAA